MIQIDYINLYNINQCQTSSSGNIFGTGCNSQLELDVWQTTMESPLRLGGGALFALEAARSVPRRKGSQPPAENIRGPRPPDHDWFQLARSGSVRPRSRCQIHYLANQEDAAVNSELARLRNKLKFGDITRKKHWSHQHKMAFEWPKRWCKCHHVAGLKSKWDIMR